MPLKKSAGNMYSWITHTWGPVTGRCGYGCAYCYVPRIARRFGLSQPAPRTEVLWMKGVDRGLFGGDF